MNKQELKKLLGKRTIDTIWFEYLCRQSISIEEANSRLEEVVEKYEIDPELNDFSGAHMEFIKLEYLLIHGTLDEYISYTEQVEPRFFHTDSFIWSYYIFTLKKYFSKSVKEKAETEDNFYISLKYALMWNKIVKEWSLPISEYYIVGVTKTGDSKTEDDHLTSAKNANED